MPMLGYPAYSIDHIFGVNRHSHARESSVLQLLSPVTLLSFALIFAGAASAAAQQVRRPAAKGGVADLSADGPQRLQGNLFIADDNVEIHYADQRLRAGHIQYNDETTETFARGHARSAL